VHVGTIVELQTHTHTHTHTSTRTYKAIHILACANLFSLTGTHLYSQSGMHASCLLKRCTCIASSPNGLHPADGHPCGGIVLARAVAVPVALCVSVWKQMLVHV
jgi:hypothetical protein